MKEVYLNNLRALLFHVFLMAIFLPFNILMLGVVILYPFLYLWFGYRYLMSEKYPKYWSVIAVFFLSVVVTVPSLIMGVPPIERIEAWLNSWSFLVQAYIGLVLPNMDWAIWSDIGYSTLTLPGYIGAIIGMFVPSGLFLAGMLLREKMAKREQPSGELA